MIVVIFGLSPTRSPTSVARCSSGGGRRRAQEGNSFHCQFLLAELRASQVKRASLWWQRIAFVIFHATLGGLSNRMPQAMLWRRRAPATRRAAKIITTTNIITTTTDCKPTGNNHALAVSILHPPDWNPLAPGRRVRIAHRPTARLNSPMSSVCFGLQSIYHHLAGLPEQKSARKLH